MTPGEGLGHCAPCVERTVQPYRKSVKPKDCGYCQTYQAGIVEGWMRASDAVTEIDFGRAETLGVQRFRAVLRNALLANAKLHVALVVADDR